MRKSQKLDEVTNRYESELQLNRPALFCSIVNTKGKPVLPGDHRVLEPPDPIPNSVVKRVIADGSVGLPHVRVGHRQALNSKTP